MIEFWRIFVTGLALVLGMMTLVWLFSVYLRNASIVDLFWGLSFVLLGWFYFARAPQGNEMRKILILVLVTIWGSRLFIYLLWRNWRKGEDFRYQAFREKYGAHRYWWVSFFQTFMLQGLLAWIISAPLLGAQIRGDALHLLDYAAVLIWLIGFVFETGSDIQLAKFKANPNNKGKLLTTGFWKYTRHPNYFGDAACWWGYGLLSIAAGSYFAALGAIIMTILIIRISGVLLLEKSLQKNKPGYEDYVRRTSPFLPLPRRGSPE